MKRFITQISAFLRSRTASKLALSLGLSLVIAILVTNVSLYRVEAYFYDLRMRWKGNEKPNASVMLLALGEKPGTQTTPPSLDYFSIQAHLAALKNLLPQKPKAIVYLNKFDPAEIEMKPAIAQEFVELAHSAEQQGTKIYLGTDVDLSGEVLPPYPLSLLPHYPAILHKDGTMFGEDKVMRRGLLTVLQEPSIHLRVAYPDLSREELLDKVKSIRGAYFYDPADSWHVLIHYPANTRVDKIPFPTIYFSDALNGKNLSAAKGKIILVETMRKDAMNDYAYTPYSRVTYTNPRLEVHGAIVDTLLKNNGIINISKTTDAALTFLLSLALAFVAISMSPSRGIVFLLIMTAGTFIASVLLFRVGLWLPLVHPFLAMFFTYYLIVPYRAILEYKKRWEVQEKHDLLVQVEEMKGNFLSLMSHDLKTPVARIQGLAEMILRQDKLQEEQKNEVQQILESTESLDKFISKILNLTKVESNEINLNRRSKDINKIIEQCVQKLSFQANAKKIKVELELDPLFPIYVDAALIIQVFTNIIDNAIKYSPEGSTVRIKSREESDFIEVTVKDSGRGLAEAEKEQLFTKFFRGKSAEDQYNKGSGLGLYLSKYFIELHEGVISAESQEGSGSEFKIRLPITSE